MSTSLADDTTLAHMTLQSRPYWQGIGKHGGKTLTILESVIFVSNLDLERTLYKLGKQMQIELSPMQKLNLDQILLPY